MKKWGLAAVGALALMLAPGCSSSTPASAQQLVEITVRAYSFAPSMVLVQKNIPVKLVYSNQDEVEHDWVIMEIVAKNKATHSTHTHDFNGQSPDLHVVAASKQIVTLEFTPLESGKYQFLCTVSGHKEKGMSGTLIVE